MTMKTMINAMSSEQLRPTGVPEPLGAKKSEVCPRCEAKLPRSRLSLRHMILTALCGGLLVAILVPAGWMIEKWIEEQSRQIMDRMVWHEPVDSWEQ